MTLEEKERAFKNELKLLLQKYNASIGFTCGDSSDTWDCMMTTWSE